MERMYVGDLVRLPKPTGRNSESGGGTGVRREEEAGKGMVRRVSREGECNLEQESHSTAPERPALWAASPRCRPALWPPPRCSGARAAGSLTSQA